MSFYFKDKTWPELKALIDERPLIILPIGTTEEHGRHLPVGTDAMIAGSYGEKLASAVYGKLPVLLMETIQYGFSMAVVRQWPGCPNVRTRVFMDYIYEICSSMIKMGFDKIVILDCHGNHDGPLRVVMREIADEYGKFMMTLSPFALSAPVYNKIKKDPEGDIHGGEWETSWILAINEHLVNVSEYTNVDAIKCNNKLRGPVSTWGLQQTKTGLYGDPTYASRETGEAIIEAAVTTGVEYLEEYYSCMKGGEYDC